MATQTQAAWDTTHTDTYFIDSATTDKISTTDATPGDNGFFIRTGNNDEYLSATITELELGKSNRVNIDGSYDDSTKEFTGLSIEKVTVTADTSTLNIAANNTVTIGTVSGTLDITSGGNTTFDTAANYNNITIHDGSLTFSGSSGTEYNVKTISAANSQIGASYRFTDTITINEGVKVKANSLNNGWGLDALTVNGELAVTGTLQFGTGDNGNSGNVINGTGTITADTFDVGNVTKAVLNVTDFQATHLVQGYTNEWGSSLTISGGNASFNDTKVKNLNITGGTVALGVTTVEGAINISGGSVTMGQGTLDKGSLTISGGKLTLTDDLTLGQAINISNDGVLDLGTDNTITINNLNAFDSTKEYKISNDTNGYSAYDTGYQIISCESADNLIGSATLKVGDKTISLTNGQYTDTTSASDSTIYFVNTGKVYTSAEEMSKATAFVVNKHEGQDVGTLVIEDRIATMDAATILSSTVGNGNIEITKEKVWVDNGKSTQVTGTLIIGSGKTLQIGSGTGDSGSINSFSAVELSGGTLYMHNNGTRVNNLEVSAKSTLRVQDMAAQTSVVQLAGTTNLKNTLTVTSGFKGTLQIDKLTGSGNLDINVGNNAYADALRVNIQAIENYTGVLSYEAEEQTNNEFNINTTGGFSVKGYEITGGARATITTGGNVTLGAGHIENSTLSMRRTGGAYSVTYTSLLVEGTGTIETQDGNVNNNSWQTVVNIGTLTGTDATLKFRSGSNTGMASVLRLNGGEGSNFSGTIEIGGYDNDGQGRKAVLSIGDETVAKNAVIKFNAENANNTAFLAVGAENVIVKGISDVNGNSKIVSRNITESTDTVSSDSTVRTLTINTQGGMYSTNAALGGSLNITKQGEGSQTFTGNVTYFKGSLSAEAGQLTLSGANTLTVTNVTVLNGATLTIGTGAATANTDFNNGVKVSGKATLQGGATISALDLSNAQSLTLNGISADAPVNVTGMLVLNTGSLTLDGDLSMTLAALSAGETLDIFNVGSFVLNGEAVTSDWTEEDRYTFDMVFANGNANYYLGYTAADDGLGGTVYIGIIPEPTTATLSLLALAALAARRRRK